MHSQEERRLRGPVTCIEDRKLVPTAQKSSPSFALIRLDTDNLLKVTLSSKTTAKRCRPKLGRRHDTSHWLARRAMESTLSPNDRTERCH